jgi:hypothetical protein
MDKENNINNASDAAQAGTIEQDAANTTPEIKFGEVDIDTLKNFLKEEKDAFNEPEFIDVEVENEGDKVVNKIDVSDKKNRIDIMKPEASILMAGIDTVLPLILIFIVARIPEKYFRRKNNIHYEDLKLTDHEFDRNAYALALYLEKQEAKLSPGFLFATSLISTYAAKIIIPNKNENK